MQGIGIVRLTCLLTLILTQFVTAETFQLPTQLSADESAVLQKTLDHQGFDPAGKRFIRFQMPQRDVYGQNDPVEVRGWLTPHGMGEPPSALLLDGEEVPVGDFESADFIADSIGVISRAAHPKSEPAPYDVLFKAPDMHSPSTLRAVWLHRLGRDDLAAATLALIRRGVAPDLNPQQLPRPLGAWHDFAFAVHPFMVGADGCFTPGAWITSIWRRFRPLNQPTIRTTTTRDAIFRAKPSSRTCCGERGTGVSISRQPLNQPCTATFPPISACHG